MNAEQDIHSLSTAALQALLDNLSSAKNFVLAQAPDVCQQMVTWEIISHLFLAAVFLLGAVTTLILTKYFYVCACNHKDEDSSGAFAAVSIVTGMVSVFCFVLFPMDLYFAMYPYFAPKVFLLHEIVKLIK